MRAKSVWLFFAVSMTGLVFAGTTTAREEEVTIGLKAGDESTASLTCHCRKVLGRCIIGEKKNKDVVFNLPQGYKRYRFSEDIDKNGLRSGGRVTWSTEDAHDATVHLHCWADAFSNVTVTVSHVTAI